MNIKNRQPRANRTIKIEISGDMFRGKTFPKIRLQGKWLAELGFKQGWRVEVVPLAPGVVTLRALSESVPAGAYELNEAPISYAKKP